MNRHARLHLALLAASLLVPFHDAVAQARAGANPRAAIDAVNKRHVDAYNRGDIAEFARAYTPDAMLMPPNAPTVRGQQAITEAWQAAWRMGVRNLRLTTVELEVHGNTASEVGSYQLDVTAADGAVVGSDRGKYVVLWKRGAEGQWKWHRDIYNSDNAPPAPPAQPGGAQGGLARAAPGDSVWVILNTVKADKRADFEEFARIFWGAGLQAADTATRRTFSSTRVLFPTKANADGTWTYVFLMDPLLSGANYSIEQLARQLLPAAEATRIVALFRGALAGGQVGHRVTAATAAALGMR